jgi:hypothetical protein
MKNRNKNVLLVCSLASCLILCFCLSEGTGPGCPSGHFPSDKPVVSDTGRGSDKPVVPDTGRGVELDSVFGCPVEDIAKYPVPKVDIQPEWGLIERCSTQYLLSADDLSFGAQGGVRCLTTNDFFMTGGWVVTSLTGCRSLREYDAITGRLMLPGIECPWLATRLVDDHDRILRVSVSPNDTESERNIMLSVHNGFCFNFFTVTQSAGQLDTAVSEFRLR